MNLDDLIAEFEDDWYRGRHPSVEAFVGRTAAGRAELLRELVQIDLEFRIKAGEVARVEEYGDRFPELQQDDAAWCELIAAEYRQRRRREPDLTLAEYFGRFPGRAITPEEPDRLPSLAGYDVLETLGRGGMGVVYKARDRRLLRMVALKFLSSGGLATVDQRERFRREAEALARLQHPNILQVFETGDFPSAVGPDVPYLVLEYAPGGTLAGRVRERPLAPREAARLVLDLGLAVQYAHERGILHRDLKPANILLAAEGTPKIADFGLAKLVDLAEDTTRTGVIAGSPSYMAPEQAAGLSRMAGPAIDIYSLGAILYELLSGRPPFQGSSRDEVLDQVRTSEAVPLRRLMPRLPRDLETIVACCLAKDPRGATARRRHWRATLRDSSTIDRSPRARPAESAVRGGGAAGIRRSRQSPGSPQC